MYTSAVGNKLRVLALIVASALLWFTLSAPIARADDSTSVDTTTAVSTTDTGTDTPTDVSADTTTQTADSSTQASTTTSTDSTSTDIATTPIPVPASSDSTPAPTLTTNQSDYAPGSVAAIFGSFFSALQNVVLTIVGQASDGSTATTASWNVQADTNGSFTTSYALPNYYVPLYLLAANSSDGALLVQTSFTDNKNIAVTISGTGSGTVSASPAIGSPSSCTSNCSIAEANTGTGTLTATASAGSTFSGWSVPSAGITSCAGNSCSFSMTNGVQSVTAMFTLNVVKTNPTLSVTNSPATFNGSPQAATVTGSVPGTASNVKYGGSATVPTNAGTYAITADFIPTDTTHYNSLTGTSAGNFVISQVSSVTTVSCPTSVTYNAAPQAPCSVTVTGASLSLTPAPTYSNQTSAGTATASYAYTGDTNHTGSSDSKNFTISKANASCAIAGYSATYTASANTATGSCTGVGSDGTLSGLDLSGTTHISAGDYPTDPWTFTAPNSNYNNDSGMVHDSIGKANANCSSITGSSGTYDGTSHGASGSCLGLGSDGTLAGLDLGSSFTDVPGGTAHWVFTDATGNYNNNSGDASIVINPADATCSISGYTGIYDGSAHGASGTCTGVTDEDLTSDVDFGAMYTSVPGGFADWTFHDPAGNYDDQGETVTIDISKATPTATLAVNNSPATYDGSTHAATVGVTTSSTPGSAQNILTGTVSNQTNAGTYAVTANFVPSDSTDYNTLTGLSAGNFIIAKANPASCSVKGYVALYDGHAHSVQQTDASCAGVAGAIGGSFDLSNTTHIAGGSYSDPWTFHSSDANYNDTTGRVNDVIIAAQPPITIAKKDFQNGSTIPIKIPSGTSGWAISLNVCNVTGTVCNPAISSGGSNVGTQFRFDSTGQQYIYNLSTKNTNGFVAGSSYTLRISSTGNPFSGNFNLGTLTIKSN